jgi:alanyl-tRNA synthetase
MNSFEIRDAFLQYFKGKQHQIVPSAPMVIKNDPTLMFTNAGMNQFKDLFLGNSPVQYSRIANSQKCLRVSGKHNDLEEVGHDTYHHTMFEMLGNWSFGDYFKREIISWAWEFLTDVVAINKDQLYVTVFEGSKDDGLEMDKDAYNFWKEHISEDRIILGSKKDNFWEMGDTGPCGPCSEIHVDIRSNQERKKISGKDMVNTGHPQVIEIWNLVFMQYNRKANGSLEPLPQQHVDTGMGFERLCMVLQNKQSNYDTDIFQAIINEIAHLSGIKYGVANETDIAMRVIADHLRAVSFAIADGQLPSNNKAGYVIRRILRRAVRYSYTFLHQTDPFIFRLVPVLATTMGNAFPELNSQQELICKVIKEEEQSFLKTLETGIKILDTIIEKARKENISEIRGKDAFELYDTYGFPLDLTALILKEKNLEVNQKEFDMQMAAQKSRSRADASVDTTDWVVVHEDEFNHFVGYDTLSADVMICKYRKVKTKGKEFYHLVFNSTPFYAESGGQSGDTGYIEDKEGRRYFIIDTRKENNLPIHITDKLPDLVEGVFKAQVDTKKRNSSQSNHSATHLMHYALRKVLGTHVEQKGSLVNSEYLRFDFSHFQKVTEEELLQVESIVNEKIRENIALDERREMPIADAVKLGAMALFGEKYGNHVRVIRFGESIELCGGTHVQFTGKIGYFKIVSEGAVAAGIRRIEAFTGVQAEEFVQHQIDLLKKINEILKHPQDLHKSIETLVLEHATLGKKIEQYNKEKTTQLASMLAVKIHSSSAIQVLIEKIDIDSVQNLKDIAFHFRSYSNLVVVLGAVVNNKPNLVVMVTDDLIKEKGMHAGLFVKSIATEIKGSGGGQAFIAAAGGVDSNGIDNALRKASELLEK